MTMRVISKRDIGMEIIVSRNRVILRDRLPSDMESWIHWWKKGEWQEYDAPWELSHLTMTEERKEKLRKNFMQSCKEELPSPRKQAIIATKESKPLGWVIRYAEKRFPDAWWIGIDICEDNYLNRGFGTEALQLWVDYLFSNSPIHRIGLRTYSFNQRMIHVAEKVGFIREGIDREIIQWQKQWIDRLQFGMLRKEWEGPSSPHS